MSLLDAINSLPLLPRDYHGERPTAYRQDNKVRSVETCLLCKEHVNRGTLFIHVGADCRAVPYMAMHALEKHHSRLYWGSEHKGLFFFFPSLNYFLNRI
ncbi:MAG: hypothetical protein V1725_07220 [archaeon]